MSEIEVGDRVTYKFEFENFNRIVLITSNPIAEEYMKNPKRILKIERIGANGWYTVYEKDKELLTEEERELLRVMIKYLCAEIGYIKKADGKIILVRNSGEDIAQIVIKDTVLSYKNIEVNKIYTLSELGLEK